MYRKIDVVCQCDDCKQNEKPEPIALYAIALAIVAFIMILSHLLVLA